VSEGSKALGVANCFDEMLESFAKSAPSIWVMWLWHAIGCSVDSEVFNAERVRCHMLKPEAKVDLGHKGPVTGVVEDQCDALVTQLIAVHS